MKPANSMKQFHAEDRRVWCMAYEVALAKYVSAEGAATFADNALGAFRTRFPVDGMDAEYVAPKGKK